MSVTFVKIRDAWFLWAIWFVMDVFMASFHDQLPSWAVWEVNKAFYADASIAAFLFWLWLTCRQKITCASAQREEK